MKVSRTELYNQKVWELMLQRQKDNRDLKWRKTVEKRQFDLKETERISRNIRLGLDKGQHVDVDC